MGISERKGLLLAGLMILLIGLVSWAWSQYSVLKEGVTSHWRVAGAQSAVWQSGHHANLGYTDQELQFQLDFPDNWQEQYLLVMPAYLDQVDVRFFDAQGQELAHTVKGDKTYNEELDHLYDIDQLAFQVPAHAMKAQLAIVSTETLQAQLQMVDKNQLAVSVYLGVAFKSAILIIIAVVMMASLHAWWRLKQLLYGAFSLHQSVWFLLLLTFSYCMPSVRPDWVHANELMFGALVIFTTTTAALFHWQLLRQLVQWRWLNTVFLAAVMLALTNLLVLFLIDRQLGLFSNSITLLVATPLLVIGVHSMRPIDRLRGFILNKIKWVYTTFMFVVVLGVFSRLGLGSGAVLSLSYLLALVALLLLGYMLYIRAIVMERQKASALSQSRLLVATNDQLKKNLEEQSALLSMLSHEVKTPLTTLKLLVFRSSLRKEIGIQLRSIENVIDDVALMDRIKSDFDCVEQFDIEKLIQGQWQSLSDGMEHEKHLHVDIEGDTGIVGNQLAMQVIIKNLISNAIKYGVGPFVQIRFKREGDNARLQVENLCNGIQPEEVGKLTKKYYRASNVSGLRGTGLGLWICKTLSEANQYKISIAVKERLFLVTIRLVL